MSDLEQKKKFENILTDHPIWPLSAVMVPQRKLYLSNRIFPFSTKSLDKFLREVRKSTEKIQIFVKFGGSRIFFWKNRHVPLLPLWQGSMYERSKRHWHQCCVKIRKRAALSWKLMYHIPLEMKLNADSENIGVCYVDTSSSCEKMTLLPKNGWFLQK